MKKRIWSVILASAMLAGTVMTGGLSVQAADEESEVISTESATLRLYGPGLFTEVGADGVTDIISGLERPGYNELIERWNELYPNVKIEIEAIPWDNWKAAVQTAAMSGDYDIIIHGNGNADFCLDLTDRIENDPEIKDNVTFYPFRRNPDNFTELRAYGISYTLNPIVCVIDKQIFEDYGVELPDSSWTYEELAEIAEKLTGTDPVTGKETYGVSMCPAADMYKNYKVISFGMNDVIFDFSEKLENTEVNIDNPKTVEVFNYIKRLSATFHPDYLEGLDLANAWTENNEIAMTWADGAFTIYNTIKANGLEDRFMFLPLPQVTEGEDAGRTSSVLQDMNMAIYKDSEQQDLAWEFLKFILTDEVAQQWLIDTCSIPVNTQYTDLIYEAMPEEYASAIDEIIVSNPYGFDSSASDYYDSTWFGTLQADVVTVGDLVIQGEETPEEAAATLQGNVETYLNSLK